MNKHTQHTPDKDDDLSGQYVLGTLTSEEREAFEKRLAESVQLQRSVNKWQAHFLSITDKLETLPAPQALSARIERSLDELQKKPKTSKAKKPESIALFLAKFGIVALCFSRLSDSRRDLRHQTANGRSCFHCRTDIHRSIGCAGRQNTWLGNTN